MQIGPPTVSPVVNDATACFKCGYALRGLAMNGVCPECGSPVQESLRGILLQYAAPEYIQTLLKGHSWVLNGILLSIVAMVVMVFAGVAAGAIGGGAAALGAVMSAVQLAISVLIFLGYIKLTEPDPKFTGTEDANAPRKWVRITAIASIGFGVLGVLVQVLSFTGAGGLVDVLSVITSIGAFGAWAAQFFAMMLYMKWLAARVPDAWIARRSKTYMWLLPILSTVGVFLVGLGPLIALVLYWNLLDRMRKHLKSIVATGVPATLKGRESLG